MKFIDMNSTAVNDNGNLILEISKRGEIHDVRKGNEACILVLKPAIQAE